MNRQRMFHGDAGRAEQGAISRAKDASRAAERLGDASGVAAHCSGEDRDVWLNRADQALLEAKRVGKNRVVRA